MDGNNRWAKKNDLSQYHAYKKGGEKLIQLTNYLFRKYKVQNISAFALSSDNLKRSKSAISYNKKLLNLLKPPGLIRISGFGIFFVIKYFSKFFLVNFFFEL